MQGRHKPFKTKNSSCDINFIKKVLITSCITIVNETEHVQRSIGGCSKNEFEFYNSFIKVDKEKSLQIICDTYLQNNIYWLEVRKYRITGTSAYPLYTFNNGKNGSIADAWSTKLKNIVFPTFSGNQATKFGKRYEDMARQAFEKIKGVKIITSGFIINHSCPWFGFSPDGFYKCNFNIYLIDFLTKCYYNNKYNFIIYKFNN